MKDSEWNTALKTAESVVARMQRDKGKFTPKSHKSNIYRIEVTADRQTMIVHHARRHVDGSQKGAMYLSSFSKDGSKYSSIHAFLNDIIWIPALECKS